MAASANPSGGHSNVNSGNSNGGGRQGHANNAAAATSNALSIEENSGTPKTVLRHNIGLSLGWTTEEQSILEDLLKSYASMTKIIRYAKISQDLNDKTVRDVALRCSWMNKKENGKRRKTDSSRKNKDKKEKVTDSVPKASQIANRPDGPTQSMMSMDGDDVISYQAIGGAAGQLLEQTAQALDQISTNFATFKIRENINLFCQARANIHLILHEFIDTPEVMKPMPQLPVKLNEELANTILPQTFVPKMS